MRVLYLTNMHNPYRDVFFEQLGEKCDLTVLFEQRSDAHRDASWFHDTEASSYKEIYLPENERGPLSQTMMKTIREGWSLIVVGCYNSPRQVAAISRMRREHLPYVVNSDGMIFDSGNLLKRTARRHVLRGANGYLIAGETCVASLRKEVGQDALVASYPFSSLTRNRISELVAVDTERDAKRILIVGQYEDYKGLDVALDAAAKLPGDLHWVLVGAGRKARDLGTLVSEKGLSNVEIVPFLKPNELVKEYQRAGLFVLPSRQECWGLVINEAAACGCPIVSTWGSGAAQELISCEYPQFLAEPGSAGSLVAVISSFLKLPIAEKESYSGFLRQRSKKYTIESMVDAHMALIEKVAVL